MRHAAALALLACLAAVAAVPAAADDSNPAPPVPARKKPMEPRRFDANTLTDPYWGITYKLAGLEEKPGPRQTGKLFDGKSGRLQVEIGIFEYADELSAKERRDAERKKWEDKRRAMKEPESGDDPAPWVTFQEETPSGGMRRHGYAWYARGCRAFLVHAYVMADAEGGAEAVKTALGALTVGPETGAAVYVQMVSKQREMPYDDPGVLAAAAGEYLKDDPAVPARPSIALELLLRAVANLPGSPLERSGNATLDLYMNLAAAQMRAKKFDDAIATCTSSMALTEKTDRPGPNRANVQYNLACAYSLAGKLDEAFAALDKAYARFDWRPVPDDHLKSDPDLENCRKDPRWAKFLETRPSK